MRLRLIRQVFHPGVGEIIGYFFVSVLIVVGLNFRYIFEYYNRQMPIDRELFAQSLGQQLSIINNNRLVNTATIVVFWSLVGLGVYTVFWLMLNFFTGVKNEVVVETDYVNKASFWERVRTPLTQFGIGAGFLLFIGVGFRLLYPLWIGMARQFFSNLDSIDLQTILLLVGAVLGSCLTLYAAMSLAKMIRAVRD